MTTHLKKRPRTTEESSKALGWFDLPIGTRGMVIDRMDPKTRCKFAQCSKTCEYETKNSKNYLYKIGIDRGECWYPELHISHFKESPFDYFLEFIDAKNNQTVVSYRSHATPDDDGFVKWTKIESGMPEDVRKRYLNEYIEKYKHCVKSFNFDDEEASVLNYDIRQLECLEEIVVNRSVESCNNRFDRIYNSVKHEYPELVANRFAENRKNVIERGFISIEQLAHIKTLNTPQVEFTFEQFSNFNGENATFFCDCHELETRILKYLEMRKKGEIHENVRSVKILSGEQELNLGYLSNMLEYGWYDKHDEYDEEDWEKKSFCFNSDSRENRVYRFYYHFEGTMELTWSEIDSPKENE